MPAKLEAASNLIKTSVTTKVLVLTSADITTNTVKLKMIEMELYFGPFFHYSYFLGSRFFPSLHFHLKTLFSVKPQC